MKRIVSVLIILVLVVFSFSVANAATSEVYLTKVSNEKISKDGLWKYYLSDGGYTLLEYCGNEENITLPETLDGNIINAISSAFINNKVKNITIPTNYINFYAYAFSECKELRSVTFSREYSDDWRISRFDDLVFSHCPKLEKVVLPNRMVEESFYDGDLKQKMYGGVLPSDTFLDCPNLVDVTFPEGLIKVGSSAFRGCTSIEKIVIPDGVEVIAVNAFKDTPSLKTLVLPDSIEEGGLNGAFNGVSDNLTVVCSPGSAADKEVKYLNEWAPSTYSIATAPSTNTTVDGDINKDEKFNIKDVTHLQKYLALVVTEETVNTDKIDFNGDGNVNIIDCTLMQKALAKE